MFASRLLRSHLQRRCRTYGQSPAFKNDVLDRIVYNSVLQGKKTVKHWSNVREKSKKQRLEEMKCDVEPVSLQYLDGYAAAADETAERRAAEVSKDNPHNFPYSIVSKIVADKDADKQTEDNDDNEINYDC
jgi:hypothetical protein